MNTHDKIKLPRLPDWMADFQIPDDRFSEDGWSWLSDRMKDYAKEAVELNQPAANVPESKSEYLANITDSDETYARGCGYVDGWNDCREAMLAVVPAPTAEPVKVPSDKEILNLAQASGILVTSNTIGFAHALLRLGNDSSNYK